MERLLASIDWTAPLETLTPDWFPHATIGSAAVAAVMWLTWIGLDRLDARGHDVGFLKLLTFVGGGAVAYSLMAA